MYYVHMKTRNEGSNGEIAVPNKPFGSWNINMAKLSRG